MKNSSSKKSGFTLIELLVVIAIIAILSSIILASLSSARAQAANANTLEEVHQVQLSMELYYDTNNGYPNPNYDLYGGLFCIGASSCTSSSGGSISVNLSGLAINNVNSTISHQNDSLLEHLASIFVQVAHAQSTLFFTSFANLKTPLVYQCTVSTNPCPYGNAWISYPQTSGNTTTFYFQKVGQTINTASGGSGSGS